MRALHPPSFRYFDRQAADLRDCQAAHICIANERSRADSNAAHSSTPHWFRPVLRCRLRFSSVCRGRLITAAFLLFPPFHLLSQTPANPPQTQTPAANPAPVHPHKRLAPVHQVAPPSPAAPVQEAPPEPPKPNWPAFDQPADAAVTWDSHGLQIDAKNSSLKQILRDVSTVTGVKVDGLSSDQRVFGVYGPGQARDVLSQLLQGSGFNVIMVGGEGQGVPREIQLSQRQTASAQPAARPAPVATSNSDDDDPPEEPVQPEQPGRPGFAPGAPPAPRSPQQIMEEMRQRQQQQQEPQTAPPPQQQ